MNRRELLLSSAAFTAFPSIKRPTNDTGHADFLVAASRPLREEDTDDLKSFEALDWVPARV